MCLVPPILWEEQMKRMWLNLGAVAVLAVTGTALLAPSAYALAAAKCTINGVTVEGDICTSDGTTCKCS
jgi:hypothetical protein